MSENNTEPKVTVVENAKTPTKHGIGEDILEGIKRNWKSWLLSGVLAAATFAAGYWYGQKPENDPATDTQNDDAPFDVDAETAV